MISNLGQDAWDKKTIELNGSILQSWQWGEFQKSLGFSLFRFAGSDYINQAVEIPLMAGKSYVYCPRGPLGNVESARKDLAEQSRLNHSIVFARIEPELEQSLPRAVKDTQPNHSWLLDLEVSEDQILAGMKPKTRYNIGLATRKGVTVRQGGASDLLTVYKLLLETSGRNKFRLHPQNYYWQMFETLGPNIKILIAEYQGEPLACMLLTLFGSTATYLHGGSSSRLKDAMAPFALHWEAIKLSQSLGYKYYDFGGIAPEGAATDHAWNGITRFKKSFGGFELASPGAFDIIYSPLWYNVYKNARALRNLIR
ncbi:MAG TPA: peptidoglycan bridge formation glycyltransferase FemA/FemB family protein [Patescibacteria group bacterium]|nr:peptidoglycan bridge formation glycyltransferase FemA/FemB family protein [Patescibacteria group bacterium]